MPSYGVIGKCRVYVRNCGYYIKVLRQRRFCSFCLDGVVNQIGSLTDAKPRCGVVVVVSRRLAVVASPSLPLPPPNPRRVRAVACVWRVRVRLFMCSGIFNHSMCSVTHSPVTTTNVTPPSYGPSGFHDARPPACRLASALPTTPEPRGANCSADDRNDRARPLLGPPPAPPSDPEL